MRRRSLRTFLVSLLSIACAGVCHAATTVVVVRHAEKASEGTDPALTADGAQRAAELARMLASAEVLAVYSSPYARTRGTVAPLAEAAGLDAQMYDPRDSDSLARVVRENYDEGVVVIAGHSNTVGGLARAFGAETDLELTEQDYDDMLVLTLHDDGTATMLHLHYGEASE